MADRIVIMKDGHIQQVGTPAEVFHRPANTFVAQFIGAPSMNMLDAVWRGGRLHVAGQELAADLALSEGSALTVGIRPDDLVVSDQAGLFAGKVNVLEPLGTETLAYVDIGGREVIAKADGRTPPALGAHVQLAADLANMHLFDSTGKAIR